MNNILIRNIAAHRPEQLLYEDSHQRGSGMVQYCFAEKKTLNLGHNNQTLECHSSGEQ